MQAKLVKYWHQSPALDEAHQLYRRAETREAILVSLGSRGWLLAVMRLGGVGFHLMYEEVGTVAVFLPPHEDLPEHLSDFREVGAVEVPDDLIKSAVEIAESHDDRLRVCREFRNLAKEEMWKQ